MFQRFGLQGAAVAVAIAIPLIVIAAAGGDKSPAPKPEETALTIRLAGSRSGNEAAFVRLTAAGDPPDQTKAFQLRDIEGLHATSVHAVDSSVPGCGDAKLRTTGLEAHQNAKEWCLKLSGVDPGHQVAGSIPSDGTVVALTVSRRHSLWPYPLWGIAVGLLAGFIVALIPGPIQAGIRRSQLSDLLNKNERPDTPPARRVTDLREWADARRAAGVSASTLMPILKPIVERGPDQALRLRGALTTALDQSELPAYLPFVQRSRTQANKTSHEVGDFVDSNGQPVPHPAARWQAALREVEEAATQLVWEEHLITQLPAGLRWEPLERFGEALSTLWALTAPDTSRLAGRLTTLRTAVENAQARADQADLSDSAGPFSAAELTLLQAPAAEQAAAVAVDAPATPAHQDPVTESIERLLPSTTTRWKILTAALALLIVISGVLTVYQTVYKPNDTFATGWDYLSLITAAAASGVIGGVLGILGWWQAKPAHAA